jgi:16S rRNA (guanine527-N7)-methyltransferase
METENKKLLIDGAKAFGIDLSGATVEGFSLYLSELLKWNRKMNLTAIRTEKEIVLKHFIDSLSAFPHLSGIPSLLDIGSGAGFPGVPLKLVMPPLKVTLIDSVRKKVDFQRHVIRTLRLKGIEAIHGRVQDKKVIENLEGRFDSVISRAFSDPETFLSLAFPFLKKGGMVLAMKGKWTQEEWQPLLETEGIGYRWVKTAAFSLPFSSIQRSIFLFEKV